MGHLLFYGSSTFLYLHAFKSNEKAKKYTVVVIFILGLLLEFFQLKMNMGRAFEYLDVVANCFGILLSILIFNKVKNKKDKTPEEAGMAQALEHSFDHSDRKSIIGMTTMIKEMVS